MDKSSNDQVENPSITLPGVVRKIIASPFPTVAKKAEIQVQGIDELYREILSAGNGGTQGGELFPETLVIELADLRQFIWEMQHESDREAS